MHNYSEQENAASRLYGNLGQLAAVKAVRPGMQIAVGGCLAQKDRAGIVQRAPWVDVVFGTHNLNDLPVLLERARHNAEALRVVEAARFSSAFTFQYSPRPGTPAADLPQQVPKPVVQERYERLVELQERISTQENARQTGRLVEVLIADGVTDDQIDAALG